MFNPIFLLKNLPHKNALHFRNIRLEPRKFHIRNQRFSIKLHSHLYILNITQHRFSSFFPVHNIDIHKYNSSCSPRCRLSFLLCAFGVTDQSIEFKRKCKDEKRVQKWKQMGSEDEKISLETKRTEFKIHYFLAIQVDYGISGLWRQNSALRYLLYYSIWSTKEPRCSDSRTSTTAASKTVHSG